MPDAFRLSRRQAAALTILLCAGGVFAWRAAGGVGELPAEREPWTARVSFMEFNRPALYVAPALPAADVETRFRQTAADRTAPWSVFRKQADWTAAREAVIARYVDLPNSAAAEIDPGPVVKLRKRTRHFRVWP